jgi:MFS family permease
MAVAFLIVQQLFGDWAFTTFNVHEVALRQSVTPDHVLGRVNSGMQLLTLGLYPLGALLGGALAQHIGMRPTLATGMCGVALSSSWLMAPSLRKLRAVPD